MLLTCWTAWQPVSVWCFGGGGFDLGFGLAGSPEFEQWEMLSVCG